MKKAKLFLLIATILMISLISVSGAWAGPSGQTSKVAGSAGGTAGQVFVGAAFDALVAENPPPAGLELAGAVSQIGPGTVCFVRTWAQIAAGDIQNPTIAVLDSGSWVSSGITTALSGIAADGSGLQYCAAVSGGTYGFLGY